MRLEQLDRLEFQVDVVQGGEFALACSVSAARVFEQALQRGQGFERWSIVLVPPRKASQVVRHVADCSHPCLNAIEVGPVPDAPTLQIDPSTGIEDTVQQVLPTALVRVAQCLEDTSQLGGHRILSSRGGAGGMEPSRRLGKLLAGIFHGAVDGDLQQGLDARGPFCRRGSRQRTVRGTNLIPPRNHEG